MVLTMVQELRVLLDHFVELGADQSQLVELCLFSYVIYLTAIKRFALGLQTGKHLVPHLNGQL